MKNIRFISLILLFLTAILPAQNKEIGLEDLWNGTFRTKGMQSLHSMANGKEYSVLSGNAIDIYDYKTLSKTRTLVSASDLNDVGRFLDYTFSNDESKVLLATDFEYVFRHSRLGIYYVYDINTKTVSKISENKIQEPTFSPDGNKIAYGHNNNLYVKDLKSGTTTQITHDG
ncbi:MAG TPA: DPP IV N-terminal domain-containing protein, partial [Aquaticitalea sp.]|nr:DPP IV N-terminal domain-containing protein [Aquaticitalea sp.]